MKLLSICLISLLHLSFIQKLEKIELDSFTQIRWVLNDKTNAGPVKNEEKLIFIHDGSPLTEELPLHLKYGGLTFKKEGILIEHIWNKCGTGNPPNHYKSNWEFISNSDSPILRIYNSRRWAGEYFISIEDNILTLIRKN